MVEWDVLKDLLVDDLFGEISIKNGRHFAMLKEIEQSAKLKRVDVYDVSSDAMSLKMDCYEQPSTLFKGNKGECCRCDYVLLTKFKGDNILLFVEIKSGRISNAEIQRQFKGAECVMDYCSSAISRFHGKHNFLDQFNKRFVCFYYMRMRKRVTRPKAPHQNSYTPYENNNTPEKMLKYSCSETPPPISIKCLV